jgi:membrane glycosyltransferase
LAIPISVWSSRVSLGAWALSRGLFLTPEEAQPPSILLTLERELEHAADRPWAKEQDALERVLGDPAVRAVHLSLASNHAPNDELRRHYLAGLELKYRLDGGASLTPREKRELLCDKEAIQDLLTQPREAGLAEIQAG